MKNKLAWVLAALKLENMKNASSGAVLSMLLAACAGQPSGQKTATPDAARTRSQIAEAMFQERCKTAGEKIYKTVENVDGIFLMKIRPKKVNYGDQFAMDDPYGRDLVGEQGYIETFIRGEYQATHSGLPASSSPPRIGYLYVEAADLQNGRRYRYTGRIEEPWQKDKTYLKGYTRFVLDRIPTNGAMPRYGVTYEDISTREEREHWIAGSSLKVIDLQTKAVIAERIGYMMDRGQGNTSGGRSPWLLAADHACPAFASRHGASAQVYQALDFVEKVLKPRMDN